MKLWLRFEKAAALELKATDAANPFESTPNDGDPTMLELEIPEE